MSQTDLHNFNLVVLSAFMVYGIVMSCLFMSDCSKIKIALGYIKGLFIELKVLLR